MSDRKGEGVTRRGFIKALGSTAAVLPVVVGVTENSGVDAQARSMPAGKGQATRAVALSVQLEGTTCLDCRIVLGGVSPRPLRALSAEEAVRGKRLSEVVIFEAAATAVSSARPMSMNAYKVDLTRGLIKQAFEQAIRS